MLSHQEAPVERPWLWMFVGVFGTLLAALLFWPGMPLEWKMYAVVHGVCAQQHNIIIGDAQLPICARNIGIYSSFLLTLTYIYTIGRARAGGLPPLGVGIALLAFVAIMAVDGFNSFFLDLGQPNLYPPDNRLRTTTGMGMGISIAVMLHLVFTKTLRKDVDDFMPVLKGWGELLGIMAINALVLAALYGNLSFMFWPLAFIAFFGLTGVLYVVCLILLSLVLGYEGRVTQLRQLARPATLALIPTLVVLGMMAGFRFWLESLGIVI
ncbi:MAG: DUF2085 domain-containing protein [Candidatus Viridilinea halotolerans]|uniref:DUF2085 domain-containing protein n=1 Tax=Candidatus Viridilinea halotolerans TaxID=2491704 RepID=A0A426TYT1_9CHLR|nr:MAG: DUF2085 domain-containing protein [Candidatus Viridilinea halotolerans]